MEHHFTGPSYTIGIEEELMICDARSFDLVNAIEALLEDAPEGEIKPELMESVLEISTDPCANTVEAGEQLRARDQVHDRVRCHGGLHVPLVRRPPAPEVRHDRDPRVRQPDARRARAGA